jgi:hypothetical protein
MNYKSSKSSRWGMPILVIQIQTREQVLTRRWHRRKQCRQLKMSMNRTEQSRKIRRILIRRNSRSSRLWRYERAKRRRVHVCHFQNKQVGPTKKLLPIHETRLEWPGSKRTQQNVCMIPFSLSTKSQEMSTAQSSLPPHVILVQWDLREEKR